jgi:hypothetical protein
VGEVSRIAISNFKNRYSLNFSFLQDINSQFIKKFFISSASIKVLISPGEDIVYIDPPTYNIKPVQKEFVNMLKNVKLGR